MEKDDWQDAANAFGLAKMMMANDEAVQRTSKSPT